MSAKELGDMPAYPVHPSVSMEPIDRRLAGMTIRQRFAMAAMQGICASPDSPSVPFDTIASQALKQADALLAELAKESK